MADIFLQFSFEVPIPEKQREWVKEILSLAELGTYPEKVVSVFPTIEDYGDLGFSWEIRASGMLWIYAEENGNTDHVASFLSALLARCVGPDNKLISVGFTYAETCSKMRLDHFGGGAILVSLRGGAPTVRYMHAADWLAMEGGKS